MLITFLVIVKQVLLLGVIQSFSGLKKWVRQILCPIIVHSSNKRITIKHKIYFLDPNELFTPIVASGFSSPVCSDCAALSQQWRTSVSPTALYSQICAKQVEWISCGLPWVATICIFKMLKSNFSFLNVGTAFGSRPLQYWTSYFHMSDPCKVAGLMLRDAWKPLCFLKVSNDLERRSL